MTPAQTNSLVCSSEPCSTEQCALSRPPCRSIKRFMLFDVRCLIAHARAIGAIVHCSELLRLRRDGARLHDVARTAQRWRALARCCSNSAEMARACSMLLGLRQRWRSLLLVARAAGAARIFDWTVRAILYVLGLSGRGARDARLLLE